MKFVRLTRISSHPEYGTFGVLTIDGLPQCVTLEDYKRDNKHNISCIPTGQYICKRYHSQKHPNTFEVTNVEGRSYILFHIGNTHKDTEGCILLGSRFGEINKYKAIIDSTNAFKDFMEVMKDEDEFILTISEHY